MSRLQYVVTAAIGGVIIATGYIALVMWALSVPDQSVYHLGIDAQMATLGRFLAGFIGVAISVSGGWLCARVAQWIAEDRT